MTKQTPLPPSPPFTLPSSLSVCPARPPSTSSPLLLLLHPFLHLRTSIHPRPSLHQELHEKQGCGGKERGTDIDLGQTELGCADYISPLLLLFLVSCLSVSLCRRLTLPLKTLVSVLSVHTSPLLILLHHSV